MSDATNATPGSAPAPATPAAPAENTLWEGAPSGWQLFWWWVSCILVVTIPIAIWKYLVLRNTKIRLTTQRLITERGVFNRTIEHMELYRVKDWTIEEPFLMRLLDRGTVVLDTDDATSPVIRLEWITGARQFCDLMRPAVEAMRQLKRVRQVELA